MKNVVYNSTLTCIMVVVHEKGVWFEVFLSAEVK